MTKEEFKAKTTIRRILEERGIKTENKRKFVSKCPLHEDRNPSFSVDEEQGVWKCHAGCGGGDVITLLARLEGMSEIDILKKYVPKEDGEQWPKAQEKPQERVIEKIYSYQDENGKELFQAIRFKPKTFRQRFQREGKWVWNLEGVRRVLYRLPEVIAAEQVWITEGEKDADNLRALGFPATCNPMGAGKWLDSYNDSLKDKDIVLCGDSDAPGRDHIDKVALSLVGKVKSTRRITLPGDFKDVSDYIAAFPETAKAKESLGSLFTSAPLLVKGLSLPIKALWEVEDNYRKHVSSLGENQFEIGNWLPSLGSKVRGLVPGEVVVILAGTGVGKTASLQNIAKHTAPLPTLFFELELPEELLYERFVGIQTGWNAKKIEEHFQEAIQVDARLGEDGLPSFRHVFICTEARLTTEKFEMLINKSELKIGKRPKVVLVDYIQLMHGEGKSRYERMSNVAEELKIIAKQTKTIIIMASQVHRKDGDDPEVSLQDGKDSGSIETSAGLVLGVWRDPKDKTKMHIKILKNTKGPAGSQISCHFRGDSMQIVETAKEPEPPMI